ncbi:MAG: class I SAM-dependent methyltransferase [Pseudomonadota bacterium]
MGRPTGYHVTSYAEMITCEPRMSAYADALRQAITPGCHVIDIGAGSGIFSLLACQFGAGSVIAIEPDDAVEVLRASAVTNGFDDRITIIQGISTDYVGSRADVIISDLRGCLPLYEQHIPSIVDARERLLAPGGRMIPARDRLFAALIHDPEFYRPTIEPWLRNAFGIDLSDGHRFAINQYTKTYFTPISLMAAPEELLEFDYATITDPNISVDFTLVPEAPGEAHGFLVWFDAELAPGIGYSNAPGEPEQVYGQTFFPFERPIALAVGDRIGVTLRANLIEGAYVWSWTSAVWRAGAARPELTYRQSTFLSQILSPAKLAQRASSYVPFPSPNQAIDRHCLSLVDGKASLSEIASALTRAFPHAFSNTAEALDRATSVTARYAPTKTADAASEGSRQ